MELAWLRTFLVVAEEGNFHRAADRLYISQPTVSLHMRKLEETWGVSLFERSGRNLVLSAAGQRAVSHARVVYGAYVNSREDMARWQEAYSETLVVAASPIVAMTFLPRWIQAMRSYAPSVQVSLLVGDSKEVAQLVEQRTADVGFTREAPASRLLDYECLYEEPMVLVAPAQDFDHDGPPLTIADVLDSYPLITHNHPVFWDDFVERLRAQFPSLKTMRVSRAHVTLHFVEQGLAASFLPETLIRQSRILGRVLEVDAAQLQPPTGQTFLIWRELRQAAADFVACVREYTSSHWGTPDHPDGTAEG